MKHVQKVRGIWVVRVTVPEELRDIIGVRELVERGLPNDTRQRERLAVGIINGFYARIEEAQEQLATRGDAPAPHLSSLAKAHYQSKLSVDSQKRSAMPTPDVIAAEEQRIYERIDKGEISISNGFAPMINAMTDLELMRGARDHDARLRKRRLDALRSGLVARDTKLVESDLRRLTSAQKLLGGPGSTQWIDLGLALMRAEIEALERTIERDAGDYGGQPQDPLLTEPEVEPTQSVGYQGRAVSGMTLSGALQAFHKERTAGGSTLAAKTMEEHKNAVRMFNEFMRTDVPVRKISKKDVIDYKNALLNTPNRYTMRFPGLTLPQAIKANAKLGKPHATLAPKTINMKWLSHLSSILQWASNNGHLEVNPAQGIRVDTGSKVHREPSYLPFTRDERNLIFGHEMFSDPSTYGTNQWALLVMLYTGVRNSSEMARMPLTNIYEEQGIPVFFLADASKNQRSKRLVPIHDDLISIGLMDYVHRLREKNETYLFPEWARRTDKVNDWFNNTFLVGIGIKTKQKVFYSFRHTLATELARAGVPRELSKMISGHAPQEVASVYIHASPVQLMAEGLNKVRFDLPILAFFRDNQIMRRS
ncbi:tyrosine-type recombinase/integrase [Marivita sp.]|uniref:tyrosine-type recombinase/integrase n=1 Tax=Marivita sp. TaxID=2003365 RepID=UPI003A8A9EE7